ncbi:MAG: biotin--[acetyl-CoA-carboxylase] ligase [Burkholderiales bacterium]|nr:biotin--[acetyl-CoA-carboxylase] ligase [Burkholderiales bacterium]
MDSSPVKLSDELILASLQPHARHVAIEVVQETGSTNADLLARIGQLQGPVLRAAENQTAGRGRAGRSWLSEAGQSLTFSLAWPFGASMSELAGLPPAVGVALAETLGDWGIAVELKWPNDVQREGNKLAGILIETAAAKSAQAESIWAVIGIGLNLAVPPALANEIGRPAAGLPELAGKEAGQKRNRLLAALLNGLASTLHQFEREGFAAFAERWNTRHAHAGQMVSIIDHGKVLHEGIASGIDRTGRLLLDTVHGQIAVIAGDVSLRAKE